MDKHPSQMDKRKKEYKDWAAKQAASVEKPVGGVAGEIVKAPAPELSGKKMEAADVERKAPTRPWEKKNGQRPWRRDYFNLHRLRPGFRPRFVDPAKVEARIQRGYVVANPDHYGGLVDIDIRESTGMGKYISRQGMVLMEIPEDGARAYEQQNEAFIQQQYKKLKKDVKEEAKAAGFDVEVEEAGLK